MTLISWGVPGGFQGGGGSSRREDRDIKMGGGRVRVDGV